MAGQETPAARPDAALVVRREVYDYLSSFIFAIAAVLLFFTFVFRTVTVDGISMQSTLHGGDRLILFDLGYTPKRGDIVVVSTPAVPEPIIKRVIATAGQTVNVDAETHKVYVNGKALDEPYAQYIDSDERGNVSFPVTVPSGHVFVMGDNRNHSYDSRFSEVGMIDTRNIAGHAVLRLFPFSKFGFLSTD